MAPRWVALGALAAGFVWLRAAHAGGLHTSFRRLDNPIAFEGRLGARLLSCLALHAQVTLI